ncbi:hypothetical protein GGS26DRAFT_591900 [Hypomontagnella submonticulosa]|nr:hypothetical protein GGS26DRAFT_591900 [Hypomontagnella submonticulosa]
MKKAANALFSPTGTRETSAWSVRAIAQIPADAKSLCQNLPQKRLRLDEQDAHRGVTNLQLKTFCYSLACFGDLASYPWRSVDSFILSPPSFATRDETAIDPPFERFVGEYSTITLQLVPAIAGIIVQALKIVVSEVSNKRDFPDAFEIQATITENSLEARGKYCMAVSNGVPQNVIENYCNALRGARIKVTGQNPKSGIKITGIPYHCISAVPWFDGVGSVPFACGDHCLQYASLSKDGYSQVRPAFPNTAKINGRCHFIDNTGCFQE